MHRLRTDMLSLEILPPFLFQCCNYEGHVRQVILPLSSDLLYAGLKDLSRKAVLIPGPLYHTYFHRRKHAVLYQTCPTASRWYRF